MITARIKKAFEMLLIDPKRFICSRPSPKGTERYCIYAPDMTPLMAISRIEMRKINDILVKKGTKWFISKSSIRSLHGGNYFKKTYKNSKNETHA